MNIQAQLEEFGGLVHQVFGGNVSNSSRELAENKIIEIQRNPDTWKIFIEILLLADDSTLFFIAQGLRYTVVKYWNLLQIHEHQLFIEKVLYCIFTRSSSLLPYSKSKLEQVVGAICIQQTSVNIVYDFLNASKCIQIASHYFTGYAR